MEQHAKRNFDKGTLPSILVTVPLLQGIPILLPRGSVPTESCMVRLCLACELGNLWGMESPVGARPAHNRCEEVVEQA